MKLSLGVFLSVVAVIYGAAIDGPTQSVLVSDSLFVAANEYYILLTDLQNDINVKLTEVRTAVSSVLKKSSRETLNQIEGNSDTILGMDDAVRTLIFNEPLSVCNVNLRTRINAQTESSGFGSSNCLAKYDSGVENELKNANEILQKYESQNGDVQQIVVQSFIGLNVFLHADDIEGRFKAQYAKRSEEWAKIRPDVEKVVKDLSEKVANFNKSLDGCFQVIHVELQPQYARLQADIDVCREFNATPLPFTN